MASACAAPPCAIELDGAASVGVTTVGAAGIAVGTPIHGPFDAGGFGLSTSAALASLGCADGTHIGLPDGVDALTAERTVARACSVTLPRREGTQGAQYVGVLDECGGHGSNDPDSGGAYRLVDGLRCLYDDAASGHSARIGQTHDGRGLCAAPPLHLGLARPHFHFIHCAGPPPWPCPSRFPLHSPRRHTRSPCVPPARIDGHTPLSAQLRQMGGVQRHQVPTARTRRMQRQLWANARRVAI